MIGEATDCPTRIYVLMHVSGDGRVVDHVSVSDIYATYEAAKAQKDAYRNWGPYYIDEYGLRDDGRYEQVRERV